MSKTAQTKYDILDIIKNRWSPVGFTGKPVSADTLEKLFEAARWSASCFNEQPWRFFVGIKNENRIWELIYNALSDGNKTWCIHVPVLVALCGKKEFSHNNKPNNWYTYDVGQSAAYISMQAMAEGLYVHQMAGFESEQLIKNLNIPENLKPLTIMAIGYKGSAENLPENLRKRDEEPRKRKLMEELIYGKPFV
ncbi:MAG: nitroreductase family protein [Calditrichaceae bacterium]|nr:nitroreductase family protein [Calditrichaceae bacterium]MBN2708450.1 nitroreductase family protein [Calditrichaceae bacterium]RQV93064.1 MAG: nitroreductase [Calditrichota bacterium]